MTANDITKAVDHFVRLIEELPPGDLYLTEVAFEFYNRLFVAGMMYGAKEEADKMLEASAEFLPNYAEEPGKNTCGHYACIPEDYQPHELWMTTKDGSGPGTVLDYVSSDQPKKARRKVIRRINQALLKRYRKHYDLHTYTLKGTGLFS